MHNEKKKKSSEVTAMSRHSKLQDNHTDFLFQCILELKSIDECYDFFEDLCTVAEIKAMSQRSVVAKMLRDKHVYSDIVAQTGASTATISRVNRSLNYGSDGYGLVFNRIDEMELTAETEPENGEQQ